MDIDRLKLRVNFAQQVEEYRDRGGRYTGMVFWDYFNLYAQLRPDSEAIMDTLTAPPRRFTRKQVLDLINLVVFAFLDLGVKRGDICLVQLPNVAEAWYLRVAFAKIGVIGAYVPETWRESEISYALGIIKPQILIIPSVWREFDYAALYREILDKVPTKPRYIFVFGEHVPEGMRSFSHLSNPKLKERYSYHDLDMLKPAPDDQWIIAPTGGTTGMPKLAIPPVDYFLPPISMQNVENGDINTKDKLLVLAPLAGGAGMDICFATPLYSGASVILLPHIDAELALRLTEQEKVSIWGGIPTYALRLLNSPAFGKYDVSSVRLWIGTGGILPLELAERLYGMGIGIVNAYGSVDAGAITRTSIYDPKEKMIGTVGRLARGAKAAVIDNNGNELPHGEPGEILIWNVHAGYLVDGKTGEVSPGMGEGWDDKGFFHTGDIGYFDEDGYLHIIGRKKDMILRGAQNIFPAEVEGLLLRHPKVKEVVIIGMPDIELGERACAYVVPKEGECFTFEEMIVYLEEQHIAKYKFPERLQIVQSLPLSVGGKYDKPTLRDDITKRLKAEGKI